jgi:PKHD-type hydroxylase
LITVIPRVLEKETAAFIAESLMSESLRDGRFTASGDAASVKRNEELPDESDAARRAGETVLAALNGSALFRATAYPDRISSPRFSRYVPGMSYGPHLDAPIMGKAAARMRTDLSATLFLSDPSSYEGGELRIEGDCGTRTIKGDCGDCVLYPANTVHQVLPVVKGVRLVSFLWIQSAVRDPARRQVLYDLSCVLAEPEPPAGEERPSPAEGTLAAHLQRANAAALGLRLRRVHATLLRMWAEV